MPFEAIPVDPRTAGTRKLTAAWGINDAPYITQPTIDGKVERCPYHAVWSRMIAAAHPDGRATVCGDWRSFMAFRKWMKAQNWEGKYFSKNVLYPRNLVFTPDTCVFVSGRINRLINSCLASARGPLPVGVDLNRGRYRASCGGHLGYFDTPEEARAAWQKEKALQFSDEAYAEGDTLLASGLLRWRNFMLGWAADV